MISSDMIVEMCEALTRLPVPKNARFIGNLGSVVSIINETAGLAEYEEANLEQVLLSLLCKRMRVEHYLKNNASLLQVPVARPTFIIGLPRTGTTLLSKLLAADSARRSLLNWEVDSPLPPPTTPNLTTDPRCTTRKRVQAIILKYKPSRAKIHWEFADDPTECTGVLAQNFQIGLLDVAVRVPEYLKHLMSLDATPSYGYHKRFLQLLQSKAPGIWNLKSPIHAHNLRALLNVYPDARLICTHRDPYRVFGSFCSLWADQAKRASHYDPMQHSAALIQYFLAGMSKLMGEARELGSDTTYHLRYADLIRDPIGELRKLYAWLSDDFSEDLASKVTANLQMYPQHKYGKHAYSLSDFGLSIDPLQPLAERYISTFDIERETYG